MLAHDDDNPSDTLKRMHKIEKEHRYASDLTSEEIDQFRTLNRFLKAYEHKIVHEVESLYSYATKKTEESSEWIDSYEGIEIKVYFFLKENDEAWDEYDDNIVVTLTDYILGAPSTLLGAGEDHTLVNVAPDFGETHCWLFHALYDHTELGWDDMLRIGSIGMECILRVGREEDKIFQ